MLISLCRIICCRRETHRLCGPHRTAHFERRTAAQIQNLRSRQMCHAPLQGVSQIETTKYAVGKLKLTNRFFAFRPNNRYGFITFERPADAYKAIDCSITNPELSCYDISFGGRRAFCREKYLDLGALMTKHKCYHNNKSCNANLFRFSLIFR